MECRTALGSKHAGIGGRSMEEGDSARRPARCCNTDPQDGRSGGALKIALPNVIRLGWGRQRHLGSHVPSACCVSPGSTGRDGKPRGVSSVKKR